MELSLSNTLLAGDPRLIDHIVGEVKSQGIFDQFRKECIADVDTKPAYQNLRTRVEGSVNSFLSKQAWKPDLNKNQFRETLRKHIHDAPYLDAGVERIVDQVVNPKVYSVFMPQIEDVVYKFLGIERPKAKERNGACGLKDLLPKDLDPVSPESDKNSFKDLSLESVDASDNLNEKEDDKTYNEYKLQDKLLYTDRDNTGSENGHISSEEKTFNETCKTLSAASSNMNLNISGQSDDKMDEEEEDSPTFEPIDIMNLNESNISNDSHLSGISELTSHRSKSPDFSNELSRDNFDCSNQDSQLSKVSSDSRLSIVTDFGSSNHGLTPILDTLKDETIKDKYEAKNTKDNFKAIKELDSSRNKVVKNNFEFIKYKDIQGNKDSKDIKSTKSVSRENSRDATDSGVKDKNEYKSSKEKVKDSESIKFKSTKEKISNKDAKYPKDKSNEKKKVSSHSNIKYDKHSKNKPKEKIDQMKDNFDKTKDSSETLKDNANKLKDEKLKETEKKDNKEAKDLKDLYKEKIRELREKKELTEKEKLNKDKLNKETKDKKDSSKDKKSSRKEHKSSSSSSKTSSVSYHENKSCSRTSAEKIADSKDKRTEMKDKMRREEKRLSKDSKNKTHFSNKTDLSDKSEKYDLKKISRGEKEDKTVKADTKKDVKTSGEKTNGKKNVKNYFQSKTSDRNDKLNNRKDPKNDSQSRDKKRKEEKRSKTKDDHSSLRKNSNDRRSTDRDGSNGSNSKTSQSNNSNSNSTSQKSGSSSLTKENQVNNSNSETSDNMEEMQVNDMKLSHHSSYKLFHKVSSQPTNDKNYLKIETDDNDEAYDTQEELDSYQTNLPLKKRHLYSDEDDKSTSSDIVIKKPKFAKNIHEAKKLMKIRKQMEKQKKEESSKEDKKVEKKITQETEQTGQSSTTKHDTDNLASMPDDERVQIIEIPDEEYDEPYPEKEFNLTLDERSIIMLGAESCAKDFLNSHNTKATLSNMELCIRESLSEIVSNISLGTIIAQSNDPYRPSSTFPSTVPTIYTKDTESLLAFKDKRKEDFKAYSNSETQSTDAIVCVDKSSDSLQIRNTSASPSQKEVAISKESDFATEHKNAKQLTEENKDVWDCHRGNDNEEADINDSNTDIRDNERTELRCEKQVETCTQSKINAENLQSDYAGTTSSVSEDNEDCRYFKIDNERSEKFSNFLESLELVGSSSLEDIIESLGGKVVSSVSKSMAPKFSKPKRSSSPLSDILVNNSNNNNEGHKQTLSSSVNEDIHAVKKRKLFTAKKPRLPSFCNTQGISNGENFVMPLSPDSDVSATSEKTASSNTTKEEKSRNRSSQRYSSDDLYKPRPLFSSSSRRSRRSNQA